MARLPETPKADSTIKWWPLLGWGSLALLIFLILVPMAGDSDRPRQNDHQPPGQATPTRSGAWLAAKTLIEDRLRSPGTATFGWESYDTRVSYDGAIYTVRGWVDAENVFGGTVRSPFVVRLRYEEETWRLTEQPALNREVMRLPGPR